jgi:hypothetical protein
MKRRKSRIHLLLNWSIHWITENDVHPPLYHITKQKRCKVRLAPDSNTVPSNDKPKLAPHLSLPSANQEDSAVSAVTCTILAASILHNTIHSAVSATPTHEGGIPVVSATLNHEGHLSAVLAAPAHDGDNSQHTMSFSSPYIDWRRFNQLWHWSASSNHHSLLTPTWNLPWLRTISTVIRRKMASMVTYIYHPMTLTWSQIHHQRSFFCPLMTIPQFYILTFSLNLLAYQLSCTQRNPPKLT